ncbi:hypothetical protein M2D63_023605 [Pseudomonas sp. BJa5]|uniref:hypothetical protein n=1 Tax=Pseudomonas sp. BJa5 TaxID=2936270 RepID=UPI002559C1F7|nr:hypothetical protein [Pseudomonas sp. BGr12]MDL2424103.1 hypothetical protein [Pseudomonas sp. BGr12]
MSVENKVDVKTFRPEIEISPARPAQGDVITLSGRHINGLESVDFHLGSITNAPVTKVSDNTYTFRAAVRGGSLLVAKLGDGKSFPMGMLIID